MINELISLFNAIVYTSLIGAVSAFGAFLFLRFSSFNTAGFQEESVKKPEEADAKAAQKKTKKQLAQARRLGNGTSA